MLSKDEEHKLGMYVQVLEASKEPGQRIPFNYYDIEWLIKKLQEINTECSKVTEELYKANKELADLRSSDWGYGS
jgi:predicted transcriptional regulator